MRINLLVGYSRREIIFALVGAIVAGWLIWFWMRSYALKQELVSVIVAGKELPYAHKLERSDIVIVQLPRVMIPDNSLITAEQAVGQSLARPVAGRQVLTSLDIIFNRDPLSAAATLPAGYMAFNLPQSWLSAPFPSVHKNDTVRLYGALQTSRGTYVAAGIIAQGVVVLSSVLDKNGATLGLTAMVREEEIKRILDARTQGYNLVVLLESAEPPRPPPVANVTSTSAAPRPAPAPARRSAPRPRAATTSPR